MTAKLRSSQKLVVGQKVRISSSGSPSAVSPSPAGPSANPWAQAENRALIRKFSLSLKL
jgi:hypothetical protein